MPSKQNPADYTSRGTSPSKFVSNNLWWNGPNWLKLTQERWSLNIHEATTIEERTKITLVTINTSWLTIRQWDKDCDLLSKYSNFNKLIRIVTYCRRFIEKISKKTNISGSLTTNELANSAKQ